MAAWQLPAILAVFSVSAVMAVVYAYLFTRRRETCLGLWTAAWTSYALRSALILPTVLWPSAGGAFVIAARWTDVLTAVLLLAGTYAFFGRRPAVAPWAAAGCAAAAWHTAAFLSGLSFETQNLPVFLFQAAVYLRIGLMFVRAARPNEVAFLVGATFMIWSVHKADFPFLRNDPAFASWGFLLAALLTLVIAVGTLLIYYERVEESLRRSEFRLNRAQRVARLGHFEQTAGDGALTCSEEFRRLAGLAAGGGEVSFDRLFATVHPDDRGPLREWADGRGPRTLEHVCRMRRPDGELRWVLCEAVREEDVGGRLLRRHGVIQDITERRRTEAALRHERDFAGAVLDTAEALIVVLDGDGRILRFNKACERVTGRTADQVLRRPFWDVLIPRDQAPAVRTVFLSGASEQPTTHYENDWLTADGERRTIRWSNSWLPVQGSRIYGIGIGIDVTEQRRAERALVESEARHRSVMENAPNIVITADRDGRIAFANSIAERLYDGGLVGTCFFSGFHRDDAATAIGAVAEVLAVGRPAAFEARGRPGADGAEGIWYDVRIGRMREADGAAGFVAILTDITTRKIAEEALIVTRFAMDRAAHGVSLTRPDGRITYMNEAGCRLLGYDPEEIATLTVCQLDQAVTPERWARHWDALRRFGTVKTETQLRTKDGRSMPIELVGNHLDGPGGPLNCSFFQDISERKQAAEALAWEAGVNRSFAEISNHLLSQAAMSIDEIAAAVLNRGTELTGSRHGFVGYIDPNTGALVCPSFTADVWEECAVADRSAAFNRFSGLCGWALTHRRPILANDPANDPRSGGTPPGHLPISRFLAAPALIDGDLLGLVAVANAERDYQDRDQQVVERLADMLALAIRRRRIEDALRKLSRAVEQSPASVLVTGLDGRIEYVNPELLHTTGYTEDELIGRTPNIFKSGRISVETYTNLWQTIQAGEVWRGELCNRKKTGELYWESASISPVRDDRGRISHFVAVKEDITDRKRAEQDLLRAKQHAELADRAKSQFLANVSHELRTPLNAIIGFSEIMVGGTFGAMGNARYLDYARDINNSGHHLLHIINDILDLSKIEADQLQLNEEIVDLHAVVRECLEMLKGRARDAGLHLDCTVPADFPPLRADRLALKRILINLLSNAIKFTPAQGRVCVSAALDGNGAVLSVADTGIGIAPEDVETAMRPFGQVESTLNRRHAGTGLGLPLTRSLVELHGGTLSIDSAVGVGTTVTVRLPAARLAAAA